MRTFKFFPAILLLVILIANSSCDLVVVPEPEPAPERIACEVNNTGQMRFVNDSSSGKTYHIGLNGVRIETLAPGEESSFHTVASGKKHTLVFQVANSNSLACNTSTPIIAQCDRRVFSCRG